MIKYFKGDLFSHRPKDLSSISILAHACNCRASWGAGVARIFRNQFPSTYEKYVNHCRDHSANPSAILGTTLLIPSSLNDPGNDGGNQFYVACLFTSDFAGARKLAPSDIVKYTDFAMQDLVNQLKDLEKKNVKLERNKSNVKVVNMPMINAGLFNVPWENTVEILEKYDDLQINVYVID